MPLRGAQLRPAAGLTATPDKEHVLIVEVESSGMATVAPIITRNKCVRRDATHMLNSGTRQCPVAELQDVSLGYRVVGIRRQTVYLQTWTKTVCEKKNWAALLPSE